MPTAYQAEWIDKVGALVGGMTYGAKRIVAGTLRGRCAQPRVAVAHIEYENGLIMLFGKSRLDEATRSLRSGAACSPVDAMERLDIERAKAELA